MFVRSITCMIFGAVMASTPASAVPRQNTGVILSAIQQFLVAVNGLQHGTVDLEVNPADLRLSLPACLDLQPFMPPGAPAWGKTTIGVKCSGDTPWTVLIPVNLRLTGTYLVAATHIDANQMLQRSDITVKEGDISEMPVDVLHEASQIIGKVAATTIDRNEVLREPMTRARSSERSILVTDVVKCNLSIAAKN